jgi:hypothetical protein
MLQHAQLSLDQAKQAQHAGNVPGLNEGIIALREALSLPLGASMQDATAHVQDARNKLVQAGGMRPIAPRTTGALAVNTNPMTGAQARTVKGGLIGDEASSASARFDGGLHYLLNDPPESWMSKQEDFMCQRHGIEEEQ